MNKNIFLFVACIIASTILISCSPKIRTSIANTTKTSLASGAEILVFTVQENVPDGLENIGMVSLGDSGFTTKCSYEIMIEKVKLEARKSGANIIKITEHKLPDFSSTCHRIRASLYFAKDITSIKKSTEEKIPLLDTDYALLHIYRFPGMGPLVSYNIKFGDSTVCRVRNNFKTTIKIKEEGLNKIWAKTESKVELPVDIVHGKQYYLRCSVKMGAFVGRPELEFVDPKTGKIEFEAFDAKHTNHPDQK